MCWPSSSSLFLNFQVLHWVLCCEACRGEQSDTMLFKWSDINIWISNEQFDNHVTSNSLHSSHCATLALAHFRSCCAELAWVSSTGFHLPAYDLLLSDLMLFSHTLARMVHHPPCYVRGYVLVMHFLLLPSCSCADICKHKYHTRTSGHITSFDIYFQNMQINI